MPDVCSQQNDYSSSITLKNNRSERKIKMRQTSSFASVLRSAREEIKCGDNDEESSRQSSSIRVISNKKRHASISISKK